MANPTSDFQEHNNSHPKKATSLTKPINWRNVNRPLASNVKATATGQRIQAHLYTAEFGGCAWGCFFFIFFLYHCHKFSIKAKYLLGFNIISRPKQSQKQEKISLWRLTPKRLQMVLPVTKQNILTFFQKF